MISYGRDPYNHDCSVLERVVSRRVLRAMEQAWRECIQDVSDPPDCILVSAAFHEAWIGAVAYQKWRETLPPDIVGVERFWYE